MALADWEALKALALSLNLPMVEEAISWGNPCLKANGRLWCWWSRSEGAPVFKMDKEERAFLIEADPETFFVTAHYAPHNLVLVRPGRCDPSWAKARLLQIWRALMPKRFLKSWDAGQSI